MKKVVPFLWYSQGAEEAAELYVSLIKDSSIIEKQVVNGNVQSVTFSLQGTTFIAFNGGDYFKFTPAVSLMVHCSDQAEIDLYWNALTEGGEESQCGWLIDKFGVSWQIIPEDLEELLTKGHAFEAMMGMNKLDVGVLREKANEV